MKKKIKFGDKIEFTEKFCNVVYINNKEYYDTKLYDSVDYDKLNIKRPITDIIRSGLLQEKVKYSSGYRKLIFTKESGSGIVVGQKIMKEGYYWPGSGPSAPYYDDSEPPSFDVKWTYTFWEVAIGMNQKILVPK